MPDSQSLVACLPGDSCISSIQLLFPAQGANSPCHRTRLQERGTCRFSEARLHGTWGSVPDKPKLLQIGTAWGGRGNGDASSNALELGGTGGTLEWTQKYFDRKHFSAVTVAQEAGEARLCFGRDCGAGSLAGSATPPCFKDKQEPELAQYLSISPGIAAGSWGTPMLGWAVMHPCEGKAVPLLADVQERLDMKDAGMGLLSDMELEDPLSQRQQGKGLGGSGLSSMSSY